MIQETSEFWIGYGATGVFLGRYFARYMHDEVADQDDPGDKTAAAWVGFILGGAIWPLIIGGITAMRLGERVNNRKFLIMAAPSKQKRRERELARTRKRTLELERELEL